MVRAVITPDKNIFPLNIPANYIGKQVEVLLYTTDELKDETDISSPVSSLRGKLNLSKEQYNDFQQHLNDSIDTGKV